MEADRAVADLELFLAERGQPLLRTAILLTGSKEAGEDLLQAALERLLRHWRTIEGNPEGYLRRTLYHLATDGWRRQPSWRRRLTLLQPTAGPGGRGRHRPGGSERRPEPAARAAAAPPARGHRGAVTGNGGRDTLWVNPAGYLPVRVMLTLRAIQIQTDFSWLAPTPANLAQLNVTVPAGFRQVPPPAQAGIPQARSAS